jgi:hypothetical protein
VNAGSSRTLRISAQGRGRYGRTLVDGSGFPRGYLMRQKRGRGFQTGDLVRAEVPSQLTTRGVHTGKVDGINAKYCRLLQHCVGYSYALVDVQAGETLPSLPISKKERLFPPHASKAGVSRGGGLLKKAHAPASTGRCVCPGSGAEPLIA